MPRARRALRIAVYGIGAMLGGVLLLLGAALAWLHSGPGQRYLGDLLASQLDTLIDGRISIGRVSGPLLGGLTADDVRIVDRRGRLVAEAAGVVARFRPLELAGGEHVLRELRIIRPRVSLDEPWWSAPGPPGPPAASSTRVRIDALVVQGGELHRSGRRLEDLDVKASARLGSSGALRIDRASGRSTGRRLALFDTGVEWGSAPIRVDGRLVIDRGVTVMGRLEFIEGGMVASPIAVRASGISAEGRVEWTGDRLDAVVDDLRLQLGAAAVRGHGRASGKLDALTVAIDAQGRGATLALDGRLNLPAQTLSFTAELAGRGEAGRRKARVEGQLRRERGVIIVPNLLAHSGDSRFALAGRASPTALQISGHGSLAPAEARVLGLSPAQPLTIALDVSGPPSRPAVRARVLPHNGGVLEAHGAVDVAARSGHLKARLAELRPAALFADAPALRISGGVEVERLAASASPRVVLHLVDVSLDAGRRSVQHLDATAEMRLGGERRVFVRSISGTFAEGGRRASISGAGDLRWSPREIEVARASIVVGGWRAGGWARVGRTGPTPERSLEVHLASVSLEPMFDGAGQRRSPFALTGHADLHGTPRELEISGAFDTSLGPALVYAVARRRGDAIDVPSVQVRCGDSRLVGRGSAANGRLVADVDELVVAPSLLRALASDLDPEWPVHASATAAGPFRAIDIMVDARAGPTTISLAARVDALARSGRITGRIDTFDGGVLKRSSHEIRLTLEFVAGGRLDRGGIVGYLAIRDGLGVIDGTPLYRAGLGARLEGRSARLTVGRLYVQGAIVEGTAGSANLDGAIDLQYNVISTNPFKIRQLGRPLQVLVGVRQILPGRLAEGRVTRRPGGPFDVEGHVSVPGMDQIKAVAQSLSGGAPDY